MIFLGYFKFLNLIKLNSKSNISTSKHHLFKFIKCHKYRATHNYDNVVYQINCKHCASSYIDQTKKSLIAKLKELKANFKSPN